MNCEMNITAGLPAGHNVRATWRVTNSYGAPFDLCDKCVEAYKTKNAKWKEHGMKITALARIDPPELATKDIIGR